jgi:hypothetical protein
VVLEDPQGPADAAVLTNVTHVEAFDFKTTHEAWSKIVSQFFHETSGRVSTLDLDIVVIRRADVYVKGRLGDGPRMRLAVEGAITAAAMSHVANTHLRTGGDCASHYGQSKEQLDADALALITHKSQQEAAAAALSGLFGNRT